MEKIIFRVAPQSPGDKLKELKKFVKSTSGLPIEEAERRLVEFHRSQNPIVIFDHWALRPFWRDWREPPKPKEVHKGRLVGQTMIP